MALNRDIGRQGQNLIGNHIPEVHSFAWPAQKARPIDHRCDPFLNGLNQNRIITWIVFQISILNEQDVTGGSSKSGDERALPLP